MSNNFVLGFIYLVALGTIAYLVARYFKRERNSGGGSAFRAAQPPREVMLAATQFFTARGWTTTTQTGENISFTRKPSFGILAVVLLLLGLIPGLIYLLATSWNLSIVVRPKNDTTGASSVDIAWNNRTGPPRAALDFQRTLAPETVMETTGASTPFSRGDSGVRVSPHWGQQPQHPASPPHAEQTRPSAMPDVEKTAADTCPACGEEATPDAVFCKRCGHRLLSTT